MLVPRIRTLDITIVIRKFVGREKIVVGWCLNEDTKKNPRTFTIEVASNQCLETFIRTILHEMVHVKQFSQNEMKRFVGKSGRPKVLWYDEDLSKIPYKDAPWELDAHETEDYLYESFMLSRSI
jgi:hypothetical protein